HYDAQVTWDPWLSPSGHHGVTTVVMGNCGVGFAPARPDRREWLIGLMEGVEDIPGAALTEGIQWGWETFPEYLDAIDASPHAIDFGTQVPHGAVRGYVMGQRGADNEVATEDDVQAMAAIVEEGLRAGALGFSTSRTILHRSIDGVPVPGTFADRRELFGIGRALKRAGHGVFQMAVEHHDALREVPWMRDLAAEIGRPLSFNLQQVDHAPDLWRDVLGALDQAAADGLPLYAQVPGRPIGILMCWLGTAHPFLGYPTWQRLAGLPPAERLRRLADPAVRAQMLSETPGPLGEFGDFVTRSFHKMFPLGVCHYEPRPDESVAAVAARTGQRPEAVVYDLLNAQGGEAMVYFPLFNYTHQDFEVVRALHAHPRTRMGLADGGAHCGAICDGGMPTYMLTHWTRDRTRGPRLPLEYVVHRQTQQTADLYGLRDRGVLAPGYRADVNIIDYEGLRLAPPRMVYDLPAQGRRLLQDATGYLHTLCRGQVIATDGAPAGPLPGRLVRGPQAGPA
ncbi:MAG: amidohydrolase family protein, partial [Myxococcales bacterium]|nr:amidohydrolase family protein [Myxococcales bacterium]